MTDAYTDPMARAAALRSADLERPNIIARLEHDIENPRTSREDRADARRILARLQAHERPHHD